MAKNDTKVKDEELQPSQNILKKRQRAEVTDLLPLIGKGDAFTYQRCMMSDIIIDDDSTIFGLN